MEDDDELLHGDQFPWEDVEAARQNHKLQRQYPVSIGKECYALTAKACPQCHASSEHLNWFYFQSPAVTWSEHCGQAGWMTVCDRCRLQVNFFLELAA